MLTFIDGLLNRITMYRLMFYYLLALILAGVVFAAFGILPFTPVALIVSTVILVCACLIVNTVFATAFSVPANIESVYITAFILALIISPGWNNIAFLITASIFAMASKYILAINKKHIFNPAAIAVALTALLINQYASWWAGGNLAMLLFIVIGGLLITRKTQRFDLVMAFFAAAIASIILTNLSFDPIVTAEKALVHTSLLFFGFVMLTEPLTTPPTRPLRIAYAVLVGALFSPVIHIGSLYSTPELALVAGNIFSFIVSPKGKYTFVLKSKTEVATGIYDFTFATNKKIKFRPGQYLEWTIAPKGADSRGNRRYFTIASSPTEPELHLGVKFYTSSSTFKQKMITLQPGDAMVGGQLSGDFTLTNGKLAFIAGGIGITPFRSMIKYLSDTDTPAAGKQNDIVLLYSNRSASEIAYREIFDEAVKKIGLRTVYINTEINKRIDADLILHEIPDYRDRIFYISGTRVMISAIQEILRDLGISRTQIKTDFFPGLA